MLDIKALADSVVGKDKDGVFSLLNSLHINYRVTYENGNRYVCTRDFKPERINLCIENRIVINADLG